MTLTCTDFLRSGFLKEGDCCPYCHQDETYLITDGLVVVSPIDNSIVASCCCKSKPYIEMLSAAAWETVIEENTIHENDNAG